MASTMEVDLEQCLGWMQAHVQITIGKTNFKISNLKNARNLRVINEKEFKSKVKQILDL